ncbi:TPA: hypothetical protein EYP38_04665 [Candidatus Micrarchaeota archaeon]|nr:hypothetical protein [Candidatus Micrarchaeota archaeon]
MADLVKSSIRITAINLILVLFWASYMISGISSLPFTLENVPIIFLAFALGMIPLALVEMDKKEVVAFLRQLAKDLEDDNDLTTLEGKKITMKKPVFMVDFEYMDRDYGRKVEIDIKMKNYD